MSVLRTAAIALVLMALPVTTVAQDTAPRPETFAPDDLATVMPTDIGGVPLCVTSYGSDDMSAGTYDYADTAGPFYNGILARLGRQPGDMRMAWAWPTDASPDEDWGITALRVPGIEATDYLAAYFAEVFAASGLADAPEAIDALVARTLELNRKVIDGRVAFARSDVDATSYQLHYPHGEVLFWVLVGQGPTMAEVVAALPPGLSNDPVVECAQPPAE